ncbi:MAG: HYR domain-containing protein [Cyclobacteriaceae bacterium]|nr:HYR domain-containing protein [Cyclobacteriaceae bacterium]
MKNIYLILIMVSCSLTSVKGQTEIDYDKVYGGTGDDVSRVVINHDDGSKLLAGYSKSNAGYDKSENASTYPVNYYTQECYWEKYTYSCGWFGWDRCTGWRQKCYNVLNTRYDPAWNYWVIKLNANGEKEWDKTYKGINGQDVLLSGKATEDGGYILGGYSNSQAGNDKSDNSRGNWDYWVVKINSQGQKEWDKTYGGSGSDVLYDIEQTPDGGFLLGGYSDSPAGYEKNQHNKGGADYWVVKINSLGEKEWDKTIGGNNWDVLTDMDIHTDGSILLGGYSSSTLSGDKTAGNKGSNDYWLVKTDQNGNKVWDKTYGGNNSHDVLLKAKFTTDGGIIAGGYSNSNYGNDKSHNSRGSNDYWVIKMNSYGQKEWDNTYGSTKSDFFQDLECVDNGFVLSGYSDSPASFEKSENTRGGADYWVLEINAQGEVLWDKTIGGTNNDYSLGLDVSPDRSISLAGYSNSGVGGEKTSSNKGGQDYWLVKLSGEAPDITPPAFSEIVADVSVSCEDVPLPATITALDEKDGPLEVVFAETRSEGDCSGNYSLLRSWIATDAAGNTATMEQTVAITDTSPPTITGVPLAVLEVPTETGACTAFVTYPEITATDGCGVVTLTYGIASGSEFALGETLVTVTATDECGNSADQSFTVTVVDQEAPTVSIKNITVELDETGNAVISPAMVDNGTSDNCAMALEGALSIDIDRFNCSNIGENEVTLSALDAHGNISTATALVTIVDPVAPVVLTNDITIQLDATGNAVITAADIDAGSTDACGIASRALDETAFNCNHIGANPVILTVTDVNGNISTAPAVVTVEDKVAPVALAQDITVQLDASGNGMIIPADVDAGSTDACGIASLALDRDVFTCVNIGPNTVVLTVTDANGNISTVQAVVTVEDNVAPEALTKDITVQLDETGNAIITTADIDAGSTDACGIASLALDVDAFTCANVGPNSVVLMVTDVNGNISTAEAIVTVEDKVAPVALTKGITVQLDDSGNALITPADIDAGSTDACGISSLALDVDALTCANVGPNTIILTVTDVNGNISTAQAVVTVEDNVAPVALARDITVQLDATGNAVITTTDIDAGSTDACGIASLALDTEAFTCTNVGPNTVILTVTDVNGNISTAEAVVTVEDKVAPVALAQDITVQLDGAGNALITPADIDAGSTDACGIASLVLDIDAFTCANVGPNTVILTVTDVNDNVSKTEAVVTVEDNVAPIIITRDIVIQMGITGQVVISVQDIDDGSYDNCGIRDLTLSKTVFTCGDIGENQVEMTGTDINGNTAIETAIVTITNEMPVVSNVSSSVDPVKINTIFSASGSFNDDNAINARFDWGDGLYDDIDVSSGVLSVSGTHAYIVPGVYTVSLIVTDICGEEAVLVYQYVVAYDPYGGFVTGGGFINSPVGASTEYPDAVGKANFGFVSKYKKGTSVPVGNAQFQFKAGDLNFHSDIYEWLVVAGENAKFKGVGTINNSGEYGFMITAQDGSYLGKESPDKFRIKIWDKYTEVIVYDNERGVADDQAASTDIAGGSIVVFSGKGNNDNFNKLTTEDVESASRVSVTLYPNPVRHFLKVEYVNVDGTELDYQVVDLSGKVVYQGYQPLSKGVNIFELKISDIGLKNGAYLLRLVDDHKQISYSRFMKQ